MDYNLVDINQLLLGNLLPVIPFTGSYWSIYTIIKEHNNHEIKQFSQKYLLKNKRVKIHVTEHEALF